MHRTILEVGVGQGAHPLLLEPIWAYGVHRGFLSKEREEDLGGSLNRSP